MRFVGRGDELRAAVLRQERREILVAAESLGNCHTEEMSNACARGNRAQRLNRDPWHASDVQGDTHEWNEKSFARLHSQLGGGSVAAAPLAADFEWPVGWQRALVGWLLRLASRTRGGIPPRRIGELLEVRARRIRAREILRVLDLGNDSQPAVTVRQLIEVPILGNGRLLAVRSAVLPHVARTQIRGDHLEIARGDVPLRDRVSLPTGFRRRRRGSETKHAGLSTGIGFHLQRRIVLPRDAKTAWQTHDSAGSVGAALLPC